MHHPSSRWSTLEATRLGWLPTGPFTEATREKMLQTCTDLLNPPPCPEAPNPNTVTSNDKSSVILMNTIRTMFLINIFIFMGYFLWQSKFMNLSNNCSNFGIHSTPINPVPHTHTNTLSQSTRWRIHSCWRRWQCGRNDNHMKRWSSAQYLNEWSPSHLLLPIRVFKVPASRVFSRTLSVGTTAPWWTSEEIHTALPTTYSLNSALGSS